MTQSTRHQVIGPPGTGKTTWLGNEVRKCVDAGLSVCVSSLTRAAAAEIVGRNLPVPRDHVATLHAHAYRSLGRPEMYGKHIADWNENYGDRMGCRMDVTGTSADTDDLSSMPKEILAGDKLFEKADLFRHQRTELDAWPADVREFHRAWTNWKAESELIDFTDMIERAITDTTSPAHLPDVLLVDEAQDLSALEYSLLCSWEKAARAMICVGDPWQALYIWRGADPSLFDDPDVPDEHKKVLGQSYRVPRAVHRVATNWIKRLSDYKPIEYLPREYEGVVEKLYDASYRNPWSIVSEAKRLAASGKTVMIIASCSYQIAPTVSLLRRQGIPFANPWRTKRGDWNPLLARKSTTTTVQRLLAFVKPITLARSENVWSADGCEGGREMGDAWTIRELQQWTDLLVSDRCLQRGSKTKLKATAEATPHDCVDPELLRSHLKDEAYAVAVLMLAGDLDVTAAARWLIENALVSKQRPLEFPAKVLSQSGADALLESPRIYVGTAHSLKGSQADIVMLYPDISSAAAKSAELYGYDSVVRTFYVAMTRAREELYITGQDDCNGVEIEL